MTEENQDSEVAVPTGPTAVSFTVWNMTGGPVPDEAIKKIEKTIARVTLDFERHDGIRLLTQSTRAE